VVVVVVVDFVTSRIFVLVMELLDGFLLSAEVDFVFWVRVGGAIVLLLVGPTTLAIRS